MAFKKLQGYKDQLYFKINYLKLSFYPNTRTNLTLVCTDIDNRHDCSLLYNDCMIIEATIFVGIRTIYI